MSADTARARLEEAMFDDIWFTRRAAADAYNRTSGDVTPATPIDVYAGPCLITRLQTIARETVRGGETEYVDRYKVSVPYDGGPFAIGDVGAVRSCAADLDLPGQEVRVTSIVYGTNAARRQLYCELIKVGPR